MLNKIPDKIAFFVVFVFGVAWAFVLTFKYLHFGYYDWDLSLYAHALWTFANGAWQSSLYGACPFADHAYYIALPLALFYKIFPTPLFLIYLKVAAFCGAGFLVYRLAVLRLPAVVAIILTVLYLIFPANVFMMLFEFNFENLAVFLILLMFYFLMKGRKKSFLITAVVLCLVKENMPLVVFMTGVSAFFIKKEDKWFWSGIPVMLGAAYFALVMWGITPWIRSGLPGGASNLYVGLYNSALSGGVGTVAQLFSAANMAYIRDLFGAQILLMVLGFSMLIGAIPLFLQNALAGAWTMHTIYFHYAASMVPFIFLATIAALAWIRARYSRWNFYCVVAVLVMGSLTHALSFVPEQMNRVRDWKDPLDPHRHELVQSVPQGRAVVATFDMLSHLVDRPRVYALYNIWKNANYITGETSYRRPFDADFALVDMFDRWARADLLNAPISTAEALRAYFIDQPWHVMKSYGDVVLLEKRKDHVLFNDAPVVLAKQSFKETPQGGISHIVDGGDVVFKGSGPIEQVVSRNEGVSFPMTFFWEVIAQPKDVLMVLLSLVKNGKVVYERERLLGMIFAPAPSWRAGEHVMERTVELLPALDTGEYVCYLSLFNARTGSMMLWDGGQKDLLIGKVKVK